MHRRDLASFDSVGKCPSFSLHQLLFGYWWLCEELLSFPPHYLNVFCPPEFPPRSHSDCLCQTNVGHPAQSFPPGYPHPSSDVSQCQYQVFQSWPLLLWSEELQVDVWPLCQSSGEVNLRIFLCVFQSGRVVWTVGALYQLWKTWSCTILLPTEV